MFEGINFRNKIIPVLFVLILIVMVFISVYISKSKEEIRSKATSTTATLFILPSNETFNIGDVKSFDLKLQFTGGSAAEKVDYIITEVQFPKQYLALPADKYVEATFSGQTNLDRIFQIDGPNEANFNGKILIEVGSARPGTGPSTNQVYTLARFYMKGIAQTPSTQTISLGYTMVVNNGSVEIPVTKQSATFTVASGAASTPSPSSVSTIIPTLTPSPSSVSTVIPTLQSSVTPSVTLPAPTATVTPSPSLTISPQPTPTSGPTPTISANTVYVRFGVKLFGTSSNPDIKAKLIVVDPEILQSESIGCFNSVNGKYIYNDIVLTVDDNGVYHPKASSAFSINSSTLTSTPDGWLPLSNLTPNKKYTVFVKGPKQRSVKMLSYTGLTGGGPYSYQNFDWSSKLLEPGDLPDPNHNNMQDCVINSIDVGLIIDRIGSTDQTALDIGDVNYDGIINGNDVAKVIYTLSQRPDDD